MSDPLAAERIDRERKIRQGLAQINAIFGGGSYGINPAKTYNPGSSAILDKNNNPFTLNHKDPAYLQWVAQQPGGNTPNARNQTKFVNAYQQMLASTGATHRDAATPYYDVGGNPFKFDPKNADYLNFLASNPGLTSSAAAASQPGAKVPGSINGRENPLLGGSHNFNTTPGQALGAPAGDPNRLQSAYIKYLISNGQLFTGTQKNTGFDQSFYDKRKQAYLDFALPSLSREAQQTQKQLTYGLANQGLLNSGAAQDTQRSFDTELNRQRQSIADAGQEQANSFRSKVEDTRGQLISQLEASADPSATSAQAITAASQFSAPSPFAPIGNLLSDWSNLYLGNRYANSYNPNTMNPLWGQRNNGSAAGALPSASSRIIQ